MNKKDFIKKIAERCETPAATVAKVIDAFEVTMVEDIFAAEDSVRLHIGTFSGYTKETAARTGRNPKTGETIEIPASKKTGYPKFKASRLAKE